MPKNLKFLTINLQKSKIKITIVSHLLNALKIVILHFCKRNFNLLKTQQKNEKSEKSNH